MLLDLDVDVRDEIDRALSCRCGDLSAPKLAICTRPALMAASIAVARKTGGTGSDTAWRQLLHHAHFHAACRIRA